MNLISEADGSGTKRMKSENDCERKLCDQKEEGDVQENAAEGIPDAREISLGQEQEEHERLVDSDNEASVIVGSDDESFTFPPDVDISDMLEEVQYTGYFPTVTDRYFTPYYKMDVHTIARRRYVHVDSQ